MSREPVCIRHRRLFTSAVALPLCLSLSACGGGAGTFVDSLPPPPAGPTPTPTPPPGSVPIPDSPKTLLATIQGYSLTGSLDPKFSWLDSPATTNGSYDVIGRLVVAPANGGPSTSRLVAPGGLAMRTNLYFGRESGDVPTYSVTVPAGSVSGVSATSASFIVDSWTITNTAAYLYNSLYGDTLSQGLGQRLTAFDKAADGTERQLFSYDITRGYATWLGPLSTDTRLRTSLDYDIGYSYVAMGEWSWQPVDLNGQAVGDSTKLLFVDGSLTPSAGIPVSGTATYDARTLFDWVKAPFSLMADFGQRSVSTRIDQDYLYNSGGDIMDYPVAIGIHVGGSAPFSNNGTFNIPLSGTVNYSSGYDINTPQTPPSSPVTGDMDGAFFGPHAEQVGGTLSLQRTGGSQVFQDAFVGRQR